MQILLNTDSHTDGREAMSDHLESVVKEALGHYGERITRVEAHLTDANGAAESGPDDIQCTLEARPVFEGDALTDADKGGITTYVGGKFDESAVLREQAEHMDAPDRYSSL